MVVVVLGATVVVAFVEPVPEGVPDEPPPSASAIPAGIHEKGGITPGISAVLCWFCFFACKVFTLFRTSSPRLSNRLECERARTKRLASPNPRAQIER